MNADEDLLSTAVADEETDLDSEPVEEVDSDEEFSRMMKTPSSQRRGRMRARNSSTPQTRQSPVQRTSAGTKPRGAPSHNVEFSLNAAGAQLVTRNSNQFTRNDSQQTQPVAPLTASQLDRLMAGLSDVDEEGEINSSSENEPEESTRSRLKLSNDKKEVSSENDTINGKTKSKRSQDDDDEANLTPVAFSVEVVDETPLKLSIYSQDTYLLVKWSHDPRWWPCKAQQEDWENKNKKAQVLFRADETGTVNMMHAIDFQLKLGDTARVIKRQGKFKIEKIAESSQFPSALCTSTGANAVTVSSAKKRAFDIPVSDLYFTDDDIRQNMRIDVPICLPESSSKKRAPRAKANTERDQNTSEIVASNATGQVMVEEFATNNGDPEVTRDITNIDSSAVAPTPNGSSRRRTRPEFTADSSSSDNEVGSYSMVEIRSSPIRNSRPLSRRRSDLKLALHDIEFDGGFTGRSPPRKRRDTTSRGSALRKQNPGSIFSDCIFTISIDASRVATGDDGDKSRLYDLVLQNGGTVLKDGLSDGISLSEIDSEGSMPDLVLSPEIKRATFAAVLTDEPRRTVKYLEMVALGWPCLHSRYIHDCVVRGEMLDWLPYLLPAGISSIPRRTMPVNANVHAFHSGWLQGLSLQDQIRKRKVAVKCAVPFCVLKNAKSHSSLLLLAGLCTPQFRTWIYSDKTKVPIGSLAVDITEEDSSSLTVSSPELLYKIQNYAALDATVFKSREWLIQCIINGTLI